MQSASIQSEAHIVPETISLEPKDYLLTSNTVNIYTPKKAINKQNNTSDAYKHHSLFRSKSLSLSEQQYQITNALKKANLTYLEKLQIEGLISHKAFKFQPETTECSLIIAVFSAHLDAVKYVEKQLQNDVSEEWKKCNLEKLILLLKSQLPQALPKKSGERPNGPEFRDLGEWYFTHKDKL